MKTVYFCHFKMGLKTKTITATKNSIIKKGNTCVTFNNLCHI